jgi:hypothetical protein
MDILRGILVDTLKAKLPDLAKGIKPFVGLLEEQTEGQLSHNSPSILVCCLPITEAPEDKAPWELRADWGIVMTVRAASALERDKLGWAQAIRVANVVYANVWGKPGHVCPARLTSLSKNEARAPDGTPTGVNYWTLTFYNWIKFSAANGTFEL